MAWQLVPLLTRDLDFFDRQRDLFSRWLGAFDDDWKAMRFDDSAQRFDRELERFRRDLLRLDIGEPDLQVSDLLNRNVCCVVKFTSSYVGTVF